MKKYKVDIFETLCKTIEVEAETREAARKAVQQLYENEEIVLSGDDYMCTDYETYSAD